MNDPLKLLYQFRNPFKKKEALFALWHKDPQTDGTDDSCRWFSPDLNEQEIQRLVLMLQVETTSAEGFWQQDKNGQFSSKLDPFAGVWNLFAAMYWRVWRKKPQPRHFYHIMSLALNPTNNFRGLFTMKTLTYEHIERACHYIAKGIKAMDRPWYKHPKWHIWHWRIQVPYFQKIGIWAFRKCAKCGGKFEFGEQIFGTWDGKEIWHERCDDSQKVEVESFEGEVEKAPEPTEAEVANAH